MSQHNFHNHLLLVFQFIILQFLNWKLIVGSYTNTQLTNRICLLQLELWNRGVINKIKNKQQTENPSNICLFPKCPLHHSFVANIACCGLWIDLLALVLFFIIIFFSGSHTNTHTRQTMHTAQNRAFRNK